MNSTNDIIAKVYYSVITVGVIIILSTIGTSSTAAVTGTIVGYSFIIVGLLMITGVSMGNLGYNGNKSVMSYLLTTGPFLFLLGIICYLLYLLSTNMKVIGDGNVSIGYYNFSNIVTTLIIAQLIIFYFGSQEKNFKETFTLSKVYGLFIYILGLVTLLCIFTLATILTDFTTDG